MTDLDSLTEEQREAVLDFSHNLLILACAGSGKTRTITSKIAYAIETGLLKPYQILAVTFTNRAAGEMRDRVTAMLPDMDLRSLEMRTFHSFGAYVLRRFGARMGLSEDFSIYDDEDSATLLSTCAKLDKRVVKQMAGKIAGAKDRGYTPQSPEVKDWGEEVCDFPRLFSAYQEALSASGNVDFADLITLTTRLLETDEDSAAYFHRRFRMVLVDEYQDSNRMQFQLLKALCSKETQLVVVGDDDQSIYSFRGAEIENILSFSDSFSNVRSIKLEKNYRSTQEILSAAHALIKHNRARHEKELLSADSKSGAKPMVLYSATSNEEGVRIARIIRNLRDYNNIAVLYRTNAQSAVFENVFVRERIPYKVIGALKFYDREEIKDALAFLRLLMNHRDTVSFRRIINKPKRGLGEVKVNSILAIDEDAKTALQEFCQRTPRSEAKVFLSAWEKAERSLLANDMLDSVLETALAETGLLGYYQAEPDKVTRDTKLQNLGTLVATLSEEGAGKEALRGFLEKLTLDNTVLGSRDPAKEDGVTLMTMHNTKGLEFDRVFVAGLEEELIPGRSGVVPKAVEEERRILYVAMTRARKALYLSFASQRSMWSRMEFHYPSRFLLDIPPKLMGGEVSVLTRTGARKDTSKIEFTGFGAAVQKKAPQEQIAKNSAGSFSVGDRVRGEYGIGVITSIADLPARDSRVLLVQFEGRTCKFIEKYAKLERI